MVNVIIIHGIDGFPERNWFSWLKKELEKREYNVFVPQMPKADKQTLKDWEDSFRQYRKYLDADSIIVGHSLGAPFVLNILEKKARKIKGTFLVAGFVSPLDVNKDEPEIKKLVETFIEKEFKWEEIKKKSEKFFVYGSDNDPYVPIDKTNELAEKLGVDPIIVEDAGHFNDESGYKEFEDLLIDIISLENS